MIQDAGVESQDRLRKERQVVQEVRQYERDDRQRGCRRQGDHRHPSFALGSRFNSKSPYVTGHTDKALFSSQSYH